MKTFTDKGAIKQAISDPLGRQPTDESVSVVFSSEQANELISELRNLGEKVDLMNQHFELLLNRL